MQQPFACPGTTVRFWVHYTVGIISSVCCVWHMCSVTAPSTHVSLLSEQNFFWDSCKETTPKSMDTLSNTMFWLPGAKVFVVVWFSQRPLCKGTGNHHSAKQQTWSVSSATHTLWKPKRIPLGKQGWSAPRSGRKCLFLCLIFLIKWSPSPPGRGTHCTALALIAVHLHLCLWGLCDYLTSWGVSQISHHRRQGRSSNPSRRNNTCKEFDCSAHFWWKEIERTGGWGKGKEQIFTTWGSRALEVTSVQIFYMIFFFFADCSPSILSSSLF